MSGKKFDKLRIDSKEKEPVKVNPKARPPAHRYLRCLRHPYHHMPQEGPEGATAAAEIQMVPPVSQPPVSPPPNYPASASRPPESPPTDSDSREQELVRMVNLYGQL